MKGKKSYYKIFIVGCILIFIMLILIKTDILEYLKNRQELENLIKKLGVWGPLVYIGLYAIITATCISVLPLTLAGGIIFGAIYGIFYTIIGASIGLSLAFFIARYFARKTIEKRFGETEIFKKIDQGVKKEGWFILATTRLLPIFPFGIQNYVYGLTSIRYFEYIFFSTIFILPGTSVFVLLAGAVASGDIKTALKLSIIASLIFFVLTIIAKLISKRGKKYNKNNKKRG